MNNLFISYDLNVPGQRYDQVIEAIKKLGNWAKVQKSFWYVSSSLSAEEAVDYGLVSRIVQRKSELRG